MDSTDFMLDANACIGLINGTSPRLAQKLADVHPARIRMSSVVLAELYYGARNSSRVAENLRVVQRFAAPLSGVAFDDACAEAYGDIRAELRRRGEPIGANDLLIAATARAKCLTLVTHDVREFERVPGLIVEDWEA